MFNFGAAYGMIFLMMGVFAFFKILLRSRQIRPCIHDSFYIFSYSPVFLLTDILG